MADEIVKAHAPKSWVEQFFEKARGTITEAKPATPASYVREAGTTGSHYLAGGTTAALLGAAHAKVGLDTRVGPADAWVAGLGAAVSVALSGHMPVASEYARRVGGAAFEVFLFRKAYGLVKHEPLIGGGGGNGVHRIPAPGKGPGVHGEDPVEAVAKALG